MLEHAFQGCRRLTQLVSRLIDEEDHATGSRNQGRSSETALKVSEDGQFRVENHEKSMLFSMVFGSFSIF